MTVVAELAQSQERCLTPAQVVVVKVRWLAMLVGLLSLKPVRRVEAAANSLMTLALRAAVQGEL